MSTLTVRLSQRSKTWLPLASILLIALAFRLVFALAFRVDFRASGDSRLYDSIAWNLAQGHGFSSSAAPPYLPTARVVPGYPFFLAALYALVGHHPVVAIPAQILLELGTVCLVYVCATRIFDTRAGLLAAALTALCPALAGYTSWLLTETLFTFLLTLFCWLMLRATHSARYASFCWAGLAAGAAAMVRGPILAFVPLWALALLALRRPLRPVLPRVALMLACAAIIVVPWIARNYVRIGRAALAGGTGFQIYMRALRVTHSDLEARPIFHQQRDALYAAGYSEDQTDQILQKQGLDRIASDPLRYVASVGVQCVAFWRGNFSGAFRLQDFSVYVNERNWAAAAIKIFLSAASNLLPLLALFAMIARRKWWRRWWPLCLLLLYWTAFHAAASSLVFRYQVPALPIVYVFSAQGLLLVWAKARPVLMWAQSAHNRG
jgi:4-amino-4-deoxy-L-arabinose transferase-like glycosyltransferase